MKTKPKRKFAWVALVLALAVVTGPMVGGTAEEPVKAWPWSCPPLC